MKILERKKAKIWKCSNARVVVSGDIVERYQYLDEGYRYGGVMRGRSYRKANVEKRADALARTQVVIRRRIWANSRHDVVPRFYTFTFREAIDDLKVANRLWGNFRKRLKFIYPDIQYVSVVEFQNKREEKYGKGAWHYHTLFFNLDEDLHKTELKAYRARMSGDTQQIGGMGEIWQNGFVDCSPTRTNITAIKSVASYVSKYLTKESFDERLKGQKVFFCSKGLRKSEEYHEGQFNADDVDNALTEKYDLVYSVENSNEKKGTILYKQYKKKVYDNQYESNGTKGGT